MVLLRNGDAVLEVTGQLDPPGPAEAFVQAGRAGIGISGDDGAGGPFSAGLTIQTGSVATTFSVEEDTRSGRRRSIQFFDAGGRAILKIYRTTASNADRFNRIADLFDAERDVAGRSLKPTRTDNLGSEARIDLSDFGKRWLMTGDQNEIDALLAEHGGKRPSAYAALPPDLASQVDLGSAERILRGASQTQTAMALRVANTSAMLTYWGPVRRIERSGPWINVLDPSVNLHLRDRRASEAWVVRAPTIDGVLTWLDFLASDGTSLCQMFGRRPDGRSLCTQGPGCWRALVADFVFAPR